MLYNILIIIRVGQSFECVSGGECDTVLFDRTGVGRAPFFLHVITLKNILFSAFKEMEQDDMFFIEEFKFFFLI